MDLLANRSDNDEKCVNYLDVRISIKSSSGFTTEVYHKVDEFNFPVVLYTFPDSNLPIKTGLNIFSAQLVRFARISSNVEAFRSRASSIFHTFHHRGYKSDHLISSCIKAFNKNRSLLHKFGCYSPRQIPDIAEMCS